MLLAKSGEIYIIRVLVNLLRARSDYSVLFFVIVPLAMTKENLGNLVWISVGTVFGSS